MSWVFFVLLRGVILLRVFFFLVFFFDIRIFLLIIFFLLSRCSFLHRALFCFVGFVESVLLVDGLVRFSVGWVFCEFSFFFFFFFYTVY